MPLIAERVVRCRGIQLPSESIELLMDMALDTLYAEMNKDGNDKHNTSDVPLRQSINADVD